MALRGIPSDISIGIVGGSGLYDLAGMESLGEVALKTPFGAPSDPYKIFSFEGVKIAFLPRHGAGHRILPGELNAKANIAGFRRLGADRLLSISAVGSLQEGIAPEDFVVPDQIIDRTRGRDGTFFGGGVVGHIPFGHPFDPDMRRAVAEGLRASLPIRIHDGGTYLCMEGPAFSTIAESNLYRSWGAAVIGMTALPEAKLAREAGMRYALVAMATDYDCWKTDAEHVSIEQVLRHMSANTAHVKQALPAVLRKLAALPASPYLAGMAGTVITDRARIPSALRKKLSGIWPFLAG